MSANGDKWSDAIHSANSRGRPMVPHREREETAAPDRISAISAIERKRGAQDAVANATSSRWSAALRGVR